MNGEVMIYSLLNYGMRVSTINESHAKYFLSLEKKQYLLTREIQCFCLQYSMGLERCDPKSGVNVQMKDGDLCTVIQDGHYFNIGKKFIISYMFHLC